MVPIQLPWMEPKDGWLTRRSTCDTDPIRLVRMVNQSILEATVNTI